MSIFKRWTKWELYKENVPYKKTVVNNFVGYKETFNVLCNVYVKTNLRTGIQKFKKVEL